MQQSKWQHIRSQIPALQRYTYLISAAMGPLHPDCKKAWDDVTSDFFEHGDACWEKFEAMITQTREASAKHLQSSPEEIAFLSSSSMAMNMFAQILKDKGYSGSVLSFEQEFPSSTLGWMKQGFTVRQECIHSFSPEQILSAPESIVVASQVQYCSGYRISIEEFADLCQRAGKILVINGTQSLGVHETPLSKVPFFCASIHKWFLAGVGLSIIKISKEYLDKMPLAGWLSQCDPWALDNQKLEEVKEARALELGCGPLSQMASVGAAWGAIDKLGGLKEIETKVLDLVDDAKKIFSNSGIKMLYDFDRAHSSGIVMLESSHPQEEAEALSKKGILVSPRRNGLRVAIHYYTTMDDILKLIEGIKLIR